MSESEEEQSGPRLVRDLMSVGVPTCTLDTPLVELVRLMLQKQWEAVVVLDENGHAAGMVSQDELVQAYARDDYRECLAEEVMRPEVPQVPPDIPLAAAAQIMQDLGVRALFMMHHAGGIVYPAAVLTYSHLLRHLAALAPGELEDLGVKAARKPPLDSFIERRDAARRRGSN